jgi:hypothetical protein
MVRKQIPRRSTTRTRPWFGIKRIRQADDFEHFFRGEFEEGRWLFRGHMNADWCLKSSLERYCKDFGFSSRHAPAVEHWLLREFYRNVAVHDRDVPPTEDPQELLALMQHHGAPTRLLDWSYSPFIATYFALEMPTGPAAVWAVNGDWLENQANEVVGLVAPHLPKPASYDSKRDSQTFVQLFMSHPRTNGLKPAPFVYTVNPRVLNRRLSIQQGVFTAVGDVSRSIQDNLSHYRGVRDNLVKIIIRPSVGRKILPVLHRMGIGRASLYPGLDGFAWSLRTRLYALRASMATNLLWS